MTTQPPPAAPNAEGAPPSSPEVTAEPPRLPDAPHPRLRKEELDGEPLLDPRLRAGADRVGAGVLAGSVFDLIYHIVTDAGLAIFFASMFFVGAIDVLSLPAWMNGMLMITGTAGFAVALLHFGLRIPREATDALDGLRSHGTLRAKILAGVAGLFMLGFLAMVLFIVIIYPVAEISRQLRG